MKSLEELAVMNATSTKEGMKKDVLTTSDMGYTAQDMALTILSGVKMLWAQPEVSGSTRWLVTIKVEELS